MGYRLRGRPHLIPIFDDVFKIAERVYEYDRRLFVVLNVIRNLDILNGEKPRRPPPGVVPKWGAWWEIHHLDERNTFALYVKYGELDARIIRDLYRTNTRVRGREVFREIDEANDKMIESSERAHRNELRAIASDLRTEFAKAAWDGSKVIFGGV